MNWTGPHDLRRQLERRWDRGQLLAAHLTGEVLFPLPLVLKKPSPKTLEDEFDAVRQWIRSLRAGSKAQRGFGYDIEWQTVRHRVHGRNQMPAAIVIPTEEDALRMIGKVRAAQRFDALSQVTLGRYPALADWLARKPLTMLQHAEVWAEVLAVLDHFCDHPRPGLYLRQLDIPGVDSKFIEAHRGLLSALLDRVLPEGTIEHRATGAKGFARRYGLRETPPLIRFRILDPVLYINGLSDLSVPPEQFCEVNLPVEQVFITENKINGLAFPETRGALVIFGLGYGLDRLKDIGWLQGVTIYYWGDIDTHGYAILNRLRGTFPDARSFLMDRDTLMAHRKLWGKEPATDRFQGELPRLLGPERAMFNDLQHDCLGDGVRLEQERIGYGWLQRALAALAPGRKSLTVSRNPGPSPHFSPGRSQYRETS